MSDADEQWGARLKQAHLAAGLSQEMLGIEAGIDAFVASTRIQRYAALNRRHGFGLLYASARYQEWSWGKTVLWRVYCQLKLNLPRRGKERLPQRIKQPL